MNSDGTGGSSVWPSDTASCPAAAARQPPVASKQPVTGKRFTEVFGRARSPLRAVVGTRYRGGQRTARPAQRQFKLAIRIFYD